MNIKVYSEIGTLKKVLVHRPGKEVERLYPEIFERLLFDDIMHLEVAQQEHDTFTAKLREEGIEVLYVEQLVAEALDAHPEAKDEFIHKFILEAGITNELLAEEAFKFFNKEKNNLELVRSMIAGIKKSEIKVNSKGHLSLEVLSHDNYPFYIDPIPNILFQRDPIASIFDGMNIHSMNKETRRREGLFYELLFKYHKEFKSIKPIMEKSDDGSMEGGDVLVINKETIFVGLSERTTPKAAEILAEKLFKRYDHLKRVVGIEIPKSHATMHLDTVLTQMDKNKFSIDAEMHDLKYTWYELTADKKRNVVVEKFDGKIKSLLEKHVASNIELIVVGNGEIIRAKREQWNDGANCLCIAPGKIVVYNRNKFTNEEMRKAGIKLIEIPSSELSRGRGGPRCMSMPLEREEI